MLAKIENGELPMIKIHHQGEGKNREQFRTLPATLE